jgi:RES domain-containing protein
VNGVTLCWRLVRATRQRSALDGMGAAYNAGRWNPLGVRVVYCADSLALAILEVRVHLAGVKPTGRFVGVEIAILASAVERPELSDLPPSWQRAPAASTANTAGRRFGARWVSEKRSVALQVPSAIVSAENIFLLNPEHPDFAKAFSIRRKSMVSLDSRLWS